MMDLWNDFIISGTVDPVVQAGRNILFGVIGACVGSFINVAAIRSLHEESWLWPPSHCASCQHRLAPFDMVPILSWFILGGKCRTCRGKIAWHYPFVELVTALTFIFVFNWFGVTYEGLGMAFFASVLIACTLTDFKALLIPHEITYPSIIIGLIFTATAPAMTLALNDISQKGSGLHSLISISQATNADPFGNGTNDLLNALAGVGICYILFDFLAFYGLKMYVKMYGAPPEEPAYERETDEIEEADDQVDTTFDIKSDRHIHEEFEVMGGGDAVLAALIAAWLGLSRLGEVLVLAFAFGTLMGAVYLALDLAKKNMLAPRLRRAAIGAVLAVVALESFCAMTFRAANSDLPFFSQSLWWQLGVMAGLVGGLLGLLWGGAKISKPFPFGPALAAGAFVVTIFGTVNPGTGR